MSGIATRHQLEVTREKLASLEELYAETKARPVENALTRELTLRSIMKMINQMKEEIVRFEAHVPERDPNRLRSERELENTKEKLRWLEDQYQAAKARPTDAPHVRDLTLRSINKMINQLKEEIVRFEAHSMSVSK